MPENDIEVIKRLTAINSFEHFFSDNVQIYVVHVEAVHQPLQSLFNPYVLNFSLCPVPLHDILLFLVLHFQLL